MTPTNVRSTTADSRERPDASGNYHRGQRSFRWLRVVMTVSLAGALVVWAASVWYWTDFSLGRHSISIRSGLLFIRINERTISWRSPVQRRDVARGVVDEALNLGFDTHPRVFWRSSRVIIHLPMWFVSSCLALAVLFLTWRVRVQPVPNACRQCGYCLVGNVSGRCPECGLDVVAPSGKESGKGARTGPD